MVQPGRGVDGFDQRSKLSNGEINTGIIDRKGIEAVGSMIGKRLSTGAHQLPTGRDVGMRSPGSSRCRRDSRIATYYA